MYFVYFNDSDEGYTDMQGFETQDQARSFIENRLARVRTSDIQDYRVIRGEELELSAVQVAIRVEMKPKR